MAWPGVLRARRVLALRAHASYLSTRIKTFPGSLNKLETWRMARGR